VVGLESPPAIVVSENPGGRVAAGMAWYVASIKELQAIASKILLG